MASELPALSIQTARLSYQRSTVHAEAGDERRCVVTGFAQALLFLSSYSPLLVVFSLLDSFGRGTPSIICAILAAVFAAMLPVLFWTNRRTDLQELRLTTAEPRDGDVLAYVATYLVPFASSVVATSHEKAALGVFIGLIGVLYVRTELFYVNPLLAIAGYRVYAADTPGGTPVILLCRRRFIAPNLSLSARRISDYIWWEQ